MAIALIESKCGGVIGVGKFTNVDAGGLEGLAEVGFDDLSLQEFGEVDGLTG